MNSKIHFVLKINKSKDWNHNLHGWSIPLLKIPGIKIHEVRNDEIAIERTSYQVDYKKQLLLGSGVQHFDYLFIQLYLTLRLSTWINVMLTAIVGLTGMLILFFLPLFQPVNQASAQTVVRDSVQKTPWVQQDSAENTPTSPKSVIQTATTKPKKSQVKSILNNSNSRDIILIIGSIPEGGGASGKAVSEDFGAVTDIAEILTQKQCIVRTSFFESSVFSNGIFQQIMGTTFTQILLDSLQNTADEICIGTIWRNVRPTVSVKNMFVAEIHLRLNFISLTTGRILYSRNPIISSQAAFTKEAALAQANEKLKNYLKENL